MTDAEWLNNFNHLSRGGAVVVQFNPQRIGVEVPDGLRTGNSLMLIFNNPMSPMRDLAANLWGLIETLRFNSVLHRVRVPWSAVIDLAVPKDRHRGAILRTDDRHQTDLDAVLAELAAKQAVAYRDSDGGYFLAATPEPDEDLVTRSAGLAPLLRSRIGTSGKHFRIIRVPMDGPALHAFLFIPAH